MMKEINRIIRELDATEGLFDYMIAPTDSMLLVSYIKDMENEIDILNDKYNAVNRDRIKYKSMLEEIRKCAEQDCRMYEIIKILDDGSKYFDIEHEEIFEEEE